MIFLSDLDRISELKAEFIEATGDNPDDYSMGEDDWAWGLGEEGAAELVLLLAAEESEFLSIVGSIEEQQD
jgi:hypothetical protein